MQSLSSSEVEATEDAMRKMAKLARRRGVRVDTVMAPWPRQVAKEADDLIYSTLKDLKVFVGVDTAEKLFCHMWQTVDDWPDESDRRSLQVIFFRLMDTMRYMVAYRKKFCGKSVSGVICSKSEAHAELKRRGMTRR